MQRLGGGFGSGPPLELHHSAATALLIRAPYHHDRFHLAMLGKERKQILFVSGCGNLAYEEAGDSGHSLHNFSRGGCEGKWIPRGQIVGRSRLGMTYPVYAERTCGSWACWEPLLRVILLGLVG